MDRCSLDGIEGSCRLIFGLIIISFIHLSQSINTIEGQCICYDSTRISEIILKLPILAIFMGILIWIVDLWYIFSPYTLTITFYNDW